MRLVEPLVGQAVPVAAVEVDAETAVLLIDEVQVVGEVAVAGDVHHVQAVVAVDARASDEVIVECKASREPVGVYGVVVERSPVRATARRVMHDQHVE